MVGTLALCPPYGSWRRSGALQEGNPLDFQNVVHSDTGPARRQRIAVTKADLSDLYRNYIACLNKQDWPMLGQFVHHDVVRNGRRIGLSGYLEMLERDFDEIPDLHFNVRMLIADPPRIASRLSFDCTPKGSFLGLDVGGKRVSFTENVFYEFRGDKIREVWSVIDKVAIESQL
jgi:predicted ester cyclase